jgi:hypothetical protein
VMAEQAGRPRHKQCEYRCDGKYRMFVHKLFLR